jgi:hypothetical protein
MMILILEDQMKKRESLVDNITTWFPDDIKESEVRTAASLDEAKKKIAINSEIMIAIVDVFMDDNTPGGIEAAKLMAQKGVQVIIHSAHDPEDYEEAIRQINESGRTNQASVQSVSKSAPPEQLKAAIATTIDKAKRVLLADAEMPVPNDFFGVSGTGLAIHFMLDPLPSFRDRTPIQDAANRQRLFEGFQEARFAINQHDGTATTILGTTIVAVFPDDSNSHGLTKAIAALKSFLQAIRSDPNLPLGRTIHFKQTVRIAIQPGRYESTIEDLRPGSPAILVGDRTQVLTMMAINARDQTTATVDDWCTDDERKELNGFGTAISDSIVLNIPEIHVNPSDVPTLACRRAR